jgi:thiamine kinase-like enzyme
MSLGQLNAIVPDPLQPAIRRALSTAFRGAVPDAVTQLTAGLSKSLNFRIVVRRIPYLLRVTAASHARSDPARQIAYATAAAEAEISPAVRYANAEDGVLITDFIDARPFPEDAAPRLARVLRRLHSLPGWPPRMDYFESVRRFVARFRDARLLPDAITDELWRHYERATRVYPRRVTDLVLNHNDLKADNILFDGSRIWLVDWEAAFLNDPYVDLAVAANFFVRDLSQEGEFLDAYFERPATAYEHARFYLMRQIVHTFAAALCMILACASGEHPRAEVSDDFDTFHRQLMAGEISLAGSEAQMRYAKVHLDRALENGRTTRFDESLALVSG